MEIDESLVTTQNPDPIRYENKVLLKISYVCGISALAVGWGIFILWLIILAITGKPFKPLMMAGFCWIGIGGIIGSVGLICLIAFAIINIKKHQVTSIKSLGILLAGIPSVFLIIYLVKLTGHL